MLLEVSEQLREELSHNAADLCEVDGHPDANDRLGVQFFRGAFRLHLCSLCHPRLVKRCMHPAWTPLAQIPRASWAPRRKVPNQVRVRAPLSPSAAQIVTQVHRAKRISRGGQAERITLFAHASEWEAIESSSIDSL